MAPDEEHESKMRHVDLSLSVIKGGWMVEAGGIIDHHCDDAVKNDRCNIQAA